MMWVVQAVVVFGIIRLSDWVLGRKTGGYAIQYGLFHRVSVPQ